MHCTTLRGMTTTDPNPNALVSVQCYEADKKILMRAAAVYGSMPTVLRIAAKYIDGMVAGKPTTQELVERAMEEAAAAAGRSQAGTARPASNGHASRSDVSAGTP